MTGTYRKRPPFHYFEMGFKVGDKLFFKDDRSITAEILTDGTDAFDTLYIGAEKFPQTFDESFNYGGVN